MRFVRTAESIFGLPTGFQRAEYLQSTGTQYIDTGFVPTNDNFQFEIKMFSPNTSAYLGYRSVNSGTATGDMRWFFNYNDGRVAIRYGDGAENSTLSFNTQTTHKFYFNGSSLYVDDVNYLTTTQKYATPVYKSFYLFSVNTSGYYSTDIASFVGRIYYAKIWDNGTLVRDFIPCIDPLGVACMYDLVGKKPYYNKGTGADFSYGRQIIPVEYLESDGTGAYIKSGITANFNSKAEVFFSCNEMVGSPAVLGGRTSSSSGAFCIWGKSNAGYVCCNFSNTGVFNSDVTAEANTKYLAIFDSSGYTVNGSKTAITTTTTFTSPELYLFDANGANTSTSGTGNRKLVGKIYKAKIWDNGTLVRDYIPCKDENNVGFMFDTLSGTVYLNAGTGAFSFGEPVYTSKLRLIKDAIRLPAGYTRVEYLESTGTQYINTGYIPTNTTGVQVRHTICADNSKDNIVFGCREGSGDTRFWEDIDWTNSDTIGWGFNSYSSTTAGTRFPISGMAGQTIVSSMNFMNDRAGRVNGVPYDTSLETKTLITITRPICLFAANYAGTMSLFTACKIFSCQISEGSTLVRSFIPVRDENNVGYMFDEVTGQLFGNVGSGSFGIGNDLTTPKVRFIQDVLPREYRPLKYLESTGTQFILSGFTPTVNTDFELELSSTKSSTNWAMGCPTWVGVHYKGVDGQIGVTNSSTSDFQQYINYARDNTRITMKLQGNTVYANGVSLGTITRRAGTLDFALFGYRDANRGATLLFSGSIYKYTIWDNGVPVRDLYPALRKSDNKPGMYDRITKQFFVNQGTGEFNYE